VAHDDDAAQAEVDERMSGGLDAFLQQALQDDTDGSGDAEGDHGTPQASEEDGDAGLGGEATEDGGTHSDEDGGTRGDAVDSRSRLVRNISRLERDRTAKASRIRELEGEVDRLRRESEGPADPLEAFRHRVARHMGVPANDPRVSERLFEYSQDITVEHLGEAVDSDPRLAERRRQIIEERRRRDERETQERRIRELEERDRTREERAQHRDAVAGVREMLAAEPHPFLGAAVDDPAELVMRLGVEAVRSGRATARTPEEGALLLRRIMGNLERNERQRAERAAKLLGKAVPKADSRGRDIGSDMDTDVRGGAASGKRGGATKRRAQDTAASGGGGRGRPLGPPPEAADEEAGPEDLHAFVNRMVERENRVRRGGR
jgi:hypothetical protein